MRIQFTRAINDVSDHQWDALWATSYPFVRWGFLQALEGSGCVTPSSGWEPYHCLAWRGAELVGAMPLYRKAHSYGEYVFDWSWANAYQQTGRNYYPKLLNAIPFTPATGPRWAAARELAFEDAQQVVDAMVDTVLGLLQRQHLSGFHSLFPSTSHEAQAGRRFMQRLDCQYHWFNQGFIDFPQFLETFAARKRKNVNKERIRVREQGFEVKMVEGKDLSEDDWRHFYRLYRHTYRKRSGHDGYLNEAFFIRVGASIPECVVMAKAELAGACVAAALYFKDEQTLYGRYWGAAGEYDGLHFECCYYQGIEYAITRGFKRFDPGAQGEHKIARGFTPVLTQSLHYLEEPHFAAAVKRFLDEERNHVRAYCAEARAQLPFKADHPTLPAEFLITPSPQ